jgi:hypothetical protein
MRICGGASISGASNGGATFFPFSELGDRLLSILCLKCVPAHKDKVEIKCMGSVGGKNTNRTRKLFILLYP